MGNEGEKISFRGLLFHRCPPLLPQTAIRAYLSSASVTPADLSANEQIISRSPVVKFRWRFYCALSCEQNERGTARYSCYAVFTVLDSRVPPTSKIRALDSRDLQHVKLLLFKKIIAIL